MMPFDVTDATETRSYFILSPSSSVFTRAAMGRNLCRQCCFNLWGFNARPAADAYQPIPPFAQ
jgi:hypothetical protein